MMTIQQCENDKANNWKLITFAFIVIFSLLFGSVFGFAFGTIVVVIVVNVLPLLWVFSSQTLIFMHLRTRLLDFRRVDKQPIFLGWLLASHI